MAEEPELGEVIFEFYHVGDSVKVSAVDPITKVEVSIVGPSAAPRFILQNVALRKLKYILKKRRAG